MDRIKAGNFNPFEKKEEKRVDTPPTTPVVAETPKDVTPPATPPKPDVPPTTPPEVKNNTETPKPPVEEPKKEEPKPSSEKTTPPDKSVEKTEEETPQQGVGDAYYQLGLIMKQEGFIGKDESIEEDADGEVIYNLYKKQNEQRLSQEVTQRETSRLMQQLHDRGVNQEHLSMALMISGGTNPTDIIDHNTYKTYSELNPDETTREDKIKVISEGLKLDGMKEQQINKYINALTIEDDDAEINKEFKSYQSSFGARHADFVKEEHKKAEQKASNIEQQRKNNDNFLTNVFTTKAINDEPLSDTQLQDLSESLTITDKVIETPEGKFRGTEFQEFVHKLKDDFPTQLYLFKILKFRAEELQGVFDKAKDTVQKNFLGQVPIEIEHKNDEKKKEIDKKTVSTKGWHFGKTVYTSQK